MGNIVFFSQSIIALLVSFASKKNVGIFFIFTVGVLIVYMGAVYDIPDYGPYEQMYMDAYSFKDYEQLLNSEYKGANYDHGYLFLNSIFANLGVSFELFHFFLGAAIISSIAYMVYRLTHNGLLVLVLYIIYPYFIDVIQLRNTIVSVCLLYILYLYSIKQRFFMCKAIGILFLASTIHKLALVYIPFLLFCYVRQYKLGRKIENVIMLVSAAAPLYVGYLQNTVYFILLDFFLDNGRFANYLSAKDYMSIYIPYIGALGMFFIMHYIKNYIIHDSYGVLSDRTSRFIQITYYLSMFVLTCSPILILASQTGRMPRNELLPVYIAIAILTALIHGQEKNCRANIATAVVVIGFCIYGYFDFYRETTYAVWEILDNNYIFDFMFN